MNIRRTTANALLTTTQFFFIFGEEIMRRVEIFLGGSSTQVLSIEMNLQQTIFL